jgi:copper(I)-binding protein
MDLVSDGAASLTGAASPAAARVELHGTTLEAGVMRMRPVASIALPAGKPVKLAPGGLHIMLSELNRPLREGDRVPIRLSIRRGDVTTEVRIEAPVRAAATSARHH